MGYRRDKTVWRYLLAVAIGAFIVGPLTLPWLAILDDSGGVETLVGVALALTIYHFLL
jgi:uncharacterized membrane protein